jgi:hypothetical protein
MLRNASPGHKLEMVGQTNETIKTLVLSGLRSRYPEDPPELLRRVLALCFNELGLNRVQGLVVVGNAPGRRMMEKCAMVHEGTLREYAVQKGQPQNCDVYALLAREFWAI